MENIQNILSRLAGLEALGNTVKKEAAMLRQELLAGGQPVTPRKGQPNAEILAAAKARYNKNTVNKHYQKQL